MDGIQAIDVMPTKFSATNTGCVLCGSEENDSRRKTKLNGKVSDLWNKLGSILDIPFSSVNVESYNCSDRCFYSLKLSEKLQEDAKTLHCTLKETFVRVERGVPSESAISPSVAAPKKSLHHGEDQRRVTFCKSAKSSYGEILPKPKPEDIIFWLTERPQVKCIQFSSFYKFSSLFAILFLSNDLGTYPERF